MRSLFIAILMLSVPASISAKDKYALTKSRIEYMSEEALGESGFIMTDIEDVDVMDFNEVGIKNCKTLIKRIKALRKYVDKLGKLKVKFVKSWPAKFEKVKDDWENANDFMYKSDDYLMESLGHLFDASYKGGTEVQENLDGARNRMMRANENLRINFNIIQKIFQDIDNK